MEISTTEYADLMRIKIERDFLVGGISLLLKYQPETVDKQIKASSYEILSLVKTHGLSDEEFARQGVDISKPLNTLMNKWNKKLERLYKSQAKKEM